MGDINQLVEMGFSQQHIRAALVAVPGKGIEETVNWLLQNAHNLELQFIQDSLASEREIDPNEPRPGCSRDPDTPPNITLNSCEVLLSEAIFAKKMECDVCHLTIPPFGIKAHIAQTKHGSYSEPKEEAALSEDGKAEQIKKAEDLLKKIRFANEAKEKKEQLEYERNRRKVGQELNVTRQRLQESEVQYEIAVKKKEKMEAQLARQRVLEDIERDKRERKEKFNVDVQLAKKEGTVSPMEVETSPLPRKIEYKQCRLQIRLTNGDTLIETFKSNEELNAVRLYVDMHRTDGHHPYVFKTTFPHRVFNDEDWSTPLCALGLPPSALLFVSKNPANS